jgi:putative transposase
VDAVEALAAKYAEAWPAWGHRKIAALMRADGQVVSTSTVQRALRRRGLLLPVGYRADRKSWAVLRRRVFLDPPTERNRVWQMDFSEFETSSGGIWRICAVIDYATKYCLAARLSPTSRAVDALACLHAAVTEAERVLGLDDLRADRGVMDVLDPAGAVIGQAPARSCLTTAAPSKPLRSPRHSPVTIRYCATCAPGSDPRRPTGSSSGSSAR